MGLVAQLEIVSDSAFQISIPDDVLSRQSFIHNGHQRRFLVVMGGELAATEKRNLHGAEIARCNLVGRGIHELFATGRGVAVDPEVP